MIVPAEIRDSGVEWVKDIPAHWSVLPLFGIFYDKQNKNSDGIENNVLSLSYGKIIRRNIEDNFGLLPESFNTYQIVDDGDIIMRLTDLQNDKRSLRVGLIREKGIITSAYLCLSLLRNQKANNIEYFYYLLHTYDKYKIFYNLGGGVRQSMGFADLKRMPLIMPPKDEQDEIVQYIKSQEEKINLFIQKKQRFIELLKEQRLSIINNMLQINAKKIRLKFCVTKVGSGVTPRGGAEVYQDEGIIFLRSQNVHNNGLRLDNVSYISEEINSEMKGSEVQFNDVLINVTGASIGRCYVYDIEAPANVNQHVCIIRPIQDIISSVFLMLQLQSEKIQTIINMVEGASREGLTNKDIKNFPLFVPSLQEQKQIVSHIKTETATIDTAIAKAEREIELIREYKEAMIAEAVMGKRGINNN